MTKLTRPQIEAVYAQGPAAVVALVEQLQQAVEDVTERLAVVEERLHRNSRNSDQPPSRDRPRRPPRSARPPSDKRPGGQPGHPGQTLPFSAHPDRLVLHRPAACAACGHSLQDLPAGPHAARQVIDLPPLALETVEHRAAPVACPACGHVTAAPFPVEAPDAVQYGPRLKALLVYLTTYQLLPYERSAELLRDLFGASPSVGTFVAAQQTATAQLAPVEAAIRAGLHAAAVVHCDETGVDLAGQAYWLHVVATPLLTAYQVARQRGAAATQRMGILPGYTGVAVHDSYVSYWSYPCVHALCNAHLLRELTAVAEQDGQAWAAQLKSLLLAIKEAVAAAQVAGQPGVSAGQRGAFRRRYRALVREGGAANPPRARSPDQQRGRVKQSKAYNLLGRLRDQEAAVLRFMVDWRVPFDNNQAERDLRMVKVQQKIAGCFRSAEGAAAFCRIRGYISTLRKQGQHIVTALEQVFRGTPLLPNLVG